MTRWRDELNGIPFDDYAPGEPGLRAEVLAEFGEAAFAGFQRRRGIVVSREEPSPWDPASWTVKRRALPEAVRRELRREVLARYAEKQRAAALAAFVPAVVACEAGCGATWCKRPLAGGKPHRFCSNACARRSQRLDPATRDRVLSQGRTEQRRRSVRRWSAGMLRATGTGGWRSGERKRADRRVVSQ